MQLLRLNGSSLTWSVRSLADSYGIEGVDFLPAQYLIQSVFLGCAGMTLERFDQFLRHSPGYARLPQELAASNR